MDAGTFLASHRVFRTEEFGAALGLRGVRCMAEHAFHRLFLAPDSTSRLFVTDEVVWQDLGRAGIIRP
jgi:hypothetical protein